MVGKLKALLRSPLVADDRGLMLVEVLVSAVSLVGLGMATFSVLDSAQEATAKNRARSVAVVLAQSDQDQMRQLPYQELLSRSQAVRDVVVDGRHYEVVSSLALVDDTVGTSDCSSTSKSAKYLRMVSEVTSVGSGLKVPVRLETLRAPSMSQNGKGSAAVRLARADGSGVAGVPVVAAGTAGATNDLGCAFFDDLPAGQVPVTWSQVGYVDENGLTTLSSQVAVSADSTSIVTGNYDLAGQATVYFTDHRMSDPGTIGPADRASWSSVTLVNEGITSVPVGKRQFTRPTPGTDVQAPDLFPFTSDYGYFAGSCDGNNPETYVDGSGVAGRVNPGQSVSAIVELPAIAITVRTGWTGQSGYYVYGYPNTSPIGANPASTMADCSERIARTGVTAAPAPVTASNGKTTIDLPYGIWKLCIEKPGTGRSYTYNTFSNTPDGTPSPLAPTKISGQRAIDLNTSSPGSGWTTSTTRCT